MQYACFPVVLLEREIGTIGKGNRQIPEGEIERKNIQRKERGNEIWGREVRTEAVKLSSPHSRGPQTSGSAITQPFRRDTEGGRPQPSKALKQSLNGSKTGA